MTAPSTVIENSCCSQVQAPDTRAKRSYKFATRAIHAGQDADPLTGAVNTPIYQTSTFVMEDFGKNRGYQYARSHNPTRTALEECLAALEGARYGLALGSGLAAASTVLNLLSAGDHVVVGEDVYGGVYRLFDKVLTRYGITFTYVNARDLEQVRKAFQPNTKLLWVESPTNPLLWLSDIRKLSQLASENNIISVVDNTFASPFLQRPIELGADVVLHSTTKYLSGHSDMIGGAILTSREELYETLKFHQNAVGAVPGPFDCYLVLRGVKTLPVRIEQHQKNAQEVAEFLEKHTRVTKVLYPGLKSHPQYDLAREQMDGFGGVVSFVLEGGLEQTKRFLTRTRLFGLAESLGGVKSLVAHPFSMTHAPVPPEIKNERGIVEGLVRLSVGLEDADDLLDDLDEALNTAFF